MKRLALLNALLWSTGSVLALDCDTLKSQVAARVKGDSPGVIQVVPAAEVTETKVIGSCGGGTMRLVLRKGAPPGFHHAMVSLGPPTKVPQVQWPVTRGDPPCDGNVTPDDVLSVAGVAFQVIPGAGSVIEHLNKTGWGVQRHQDYAECRLVCATVPIGVALQDEMIAVLWNPHGPDIKGDRVLKRTEGTWEGQGNEAYFRVDKGYSATTVGQNQLVCKTARNWASYSRLFQLQITY